MQYAAGRRHPLIIKGQPCNYFCSPFVSALQVFLPLCTDAACTYPALFAFVSVDWPFEGDNAWT